MKKLIYILMIAAVLVSCKKNTTDTPSPVQKQEVEFQINTILPDAGRDYTIPFCDDNLSPDYAMIIFADYTGDGLADTLYADVYYVGDQLYTKALMMLPGNYTVTGFLVMDDLTDDGPTADDLIYKAAPLPTSPFFEFIVNGLADDQGNPLQFTVEQFKKTKVLIDVLCFVKDDYQLFGFFWFQITEITVREMCFFGDLCLKHPSDYAGSLYENGGLHIDEPAIFEIWAFHKVGSGPWVAMNGGAPYTNASFYGTGSPLCIKYADYDHEVDQYKFTLKVLVKMANTFDYDSLFTWEWSDNFVDTYDPGQDGVEEFVVGNCNYSPTDIQLDPYMNLPSRISMYIHYMNYSNDFYWNWKMTYAEPYDGDVYDIPYNTLVGAWCGDYYLHLANGTHTLTLVYSTLDDPSTMVNGGNGLTTTMLNQLNYLFNHYESSYGLNPAAPGSVANGKAIQVSIWGVRHASGNTPANPDGAPGGSLGLTMASDALLNGANYSPLPGEWAGVLFFAPTVYNREQAYATQLILITVDP